jgi:hypothetical protein
MAGNARADAISRARLRTLPQRFVFLPGIAAFASETDGSTLAPLMLTGRRSAFVHKETAS